MPWESLKYRWPFGDVSMDRIPLPRVRTTVWWATPSRLGVSFTRRMSPVLYAPKKNFPLLAAPSPHFRQNTRPVGAMVGVYHRFGRMRGFGPLLLVSYGEVPLQFSFGPHPKLRPATIRLTSSLHSGPFSVSHRRWVAGSKSNP